MTSEQTASTPSRTNEKADAESGTNSSSPADPYAHLPRHQAAILRRQVHAPDPRHSVGNLYRYASRLELAALAVSALCAAASGAALPVMTVLFGGLQGVFQDYSTREDASYDSFKRGMTSYVLYFVYLGVGEFAVTYVSTVGFIHVGERIAAKIRRAYLESCVSQNMAFFDAFGAGEATASITSDVNLVQDGISEKVALTLSAVATFVAAFVIGFVNYWKLTLILSCVVVAWSLNMTLTSRFMLGNMGRYFAAYAEGGNLAGEVLASVRSAIAFGAQGRLAGQYDAHVARAEHYGIRFKSATGLMVAGLQVVMILGYALAFWQGSKFLVEGAITLSKFVTVLMAVMVGAFTLGNVAPNVQAFTTAIAAAGRIFAVIDRASPMDFRDDAGLTLDKVQGHVRLENVQHVYPSRPGVTVLRGVSLDVPAGKTTALVGASGCGKSTVVGLLERFYDPVEGAIYLDGHDISKMNLHWLRQQMALVSQEPTLFGVTIFENICHGLSGIEKYRSESPDMQRERVVEAAKKANAHDFITQLPQGYDTNVGQKGFMLSGGQKQRIAIARALVSDPQILLLDEATAALDSQSEDSVIKALRSASAGRTTITIAHRLYTIKDADNIVVMSGGLVEEQGTHDELLGRQGAYAKLVAAQSLEGKGSHPAASQDISEGSGTKAGQGDGDEATSPGAETGLVNYPTQEPSAEQKRYSLWTLFKFIIALNGPEWKLMLLGCLFSIICGLGNPTTAVFFAKQIATLSRPMPPHSPSEVKQDSDFWSSMYVMLAFVLCLAFAIQGISFAKTSEALVRRVRSKAFQALLRQDVSFFDEDANTPGALTSLLSSEATHVAGLSGVTLGTLIISISTLISACALALAIGWKLSLVCIAALPVLTGCGFLHFWVLARFAMRSKAAYESSAAYASEAISAIRTVAALRREAGVVETYRQSLAAQQRRGLISTLKSSGAYAASQSCLFLCFALCFWYGGTLIGRREYTMFQFFLCFMSVLFGAQNVSLIFSFAPDMGKAVSAAHQLKTLFDRQPSIDTWSETGGQIDRFSNRIELRNINFHYPTRPSQPVLRGLSLTIKRGQYVALVGGSGCGKSTALALLERFYDPQSGEILIDGRNIETLNVNRYRRLIALVSQEPTLYHGSVKDNIILGSPSGDASDEEIERVAREANIYDFITSLPDGLNTIVGHKGDLLSGGQQQRIAIARSLIRNPEILLLDEATSALDTTSEKVVQAALDQAAKGRTTVAVAHRLSTIQKADVIYVLDKGEVIASGTHSELMEKSERYAELVNLQSLGS